MQGGDEENRAGRDEENCAGRDEKNRAGWHTENAAGDSAGGYAKTAGDKDAGMFAGGRLCCVLAVLPVDTFTGKPILTRDFTVEMDGARPPIRKREGFFVFYYAKNAFGKKERPPSGDGNTLTVRLRGRGYQETVLRVPVSSVSPKEPMITVRMNPNAFYSFPPQTVRMKGRLSGNCCLSAAFLQKENSLRLAEDYHAGEEHIAVYRGEQSNLTGSLFYMEAADAADAVQDAGNGSDAETGCGAEVGDCAETEISAGRGRRGGFVLLGEAEGGRTGRYRLSAPIPESFDKRTTRLYPARMQKAGDQTEFYFFAFRADMRTQDSAMTGGRKTAPKGVGSCKKESLQEGCDMLCRVETAAGIKEYRFFVESSGTKVMDF